MLIPGPAALTSSPVPNPGGLAGQVLRSSNADPTTFRYRGPYEFWLEDFGTGGNITYATGDPVTSGDNCTPFLNAATTAAVSLNPNRGGITIRFDRQRYWFATQPSNITIALSMIGSGTPGAYFTGAKGCTQLVIADGVTGLPFVAASHSTIGPVLRDFLVYGNSGNTTANGILLQDWDGFEVSHVATANFPGGTGLDLYGGVAGDAQYGLVHDFRGGGSLKEIRLRGSAPNGVVINAPRIEGNPGSSAPVSASTIGISVETGDTCRIIAPRIQGYGIGIDHESAAQSCEVYAMRGEYNNRHVKLGSSSRGFGLYGGSFDDNLLPGGSTSIGVDIVTGAADYVLMPNDFQLSKAGFVEINNYDPTKGTLVHKNVTTFEAAVVYASNLPTADPHVVGRLWVNSGVVTRSAG